MFMKHCASTIYIVLVHKSGGLNLNQHFRIDTVNSEIFARVSFLRNLATGKFHENKTLTND